MPQSNTKSPGLVAKFLQLLALSSFGIAQPLFDLLAKNPGFLVVHRAQLIDLLILTAVLVLCIPVLIILIEFALSRISPRLSNVAHGAFLALLLGLVILPLCDGFFALQGWISMAFAAILGLVFVWTYFRWAAIRSNLAILALATPIFVAMFLFSAGKAVTPAAPVASNASNGTTTDVPVVVLILDELPLASLLDKSGQLDEKLYPNFARLGSVSNWYPQATSISGATLKAVPAILTGCFSGWKQLPNLKSHPRSLFTLLGPSHTCVIQEVQTDLCPTEYVKDPMPDLGSRLDQLATDVVVLYKHIIYPETKRSHLPPINNRWNNFTGGDSRQTNKPAPKSKVQHFQQFVDNIQKTSKPLLAVSHLLMPHNPYRFYPDGSIHNWREGEGEDLDGHRWVGDPLIVQHAYKRHLLQLICTDNLLGRLLDRLEETDSFDDALVVVTADHGACFTPGQSHRHLTEDNVHDIMSVPLFIKFPHQKTGREIARHVQSVDILPTILDFLELDPGWEMDGVSFLDEELPDRKILDFLDQDKRVHRQFPVERLQNTDQTTQWKKSEFSDVDSVESLFSHAAIDPWLNRKTNTLPMGERTNFLLKLDFPQRYENVNLSGSFVPGEITGNLLGWTSSERTTLAVAVNGVVAGFTETYFPRDGEEHCSWSFLVPKKTFSSGKNELAIFLVLEGNEGVVFHSLYRGIQSFQDTILGARTVFSVGESGFHKDEMWDGIPFRWTNGNAILNIPTDPQNRPQTVQFEFVGTGPQGTNLKICANGLTIFEGHVPAGNWIQNLDLPESGNKNSIVLEIVSGKFSPDESGSENARILGVGVAKVLLGYTGDKP